MKILSRLYLNGGQKQIGKILLEYLSNKREKVNSYLDIDKLRIDYKPETELEDFLINFSFYIEAEKLPPVEYLVLREAVTPKKIEDVSAKIKVPEDILKKVIIGLHVKGMLVIKGNLIEINWRKKDLLEKSLIKPYWPLKVK